VPTLGRIRAAPSPRSTDQSIPHSSGGTVVVVQHAAQALVPLDWSCGHKAPRLWNDQPIAQPLVIPLGVVVGDKIVNGPVRNDSSPNRIIRSRQDFCLIRGICG
jgi:hypothetical protein